MDTKPRPLRKQACRFFTTPRGCRNGNSCHFSHDISAASNTNQAGQKPTAPTRSRASRAQVTKDEENDNKPEARFRRWRVYASEESAKTTLGPRLASFFREAYELLLTDPAIKQDIVNHLSSEGGLARIHELLNRDFWSLDARSQSMIFESEILPFLRSISHPNVTSSLLLEEPRHQIYTAIYGPGGKRGLTLFGFIAAISAGLHLEALEATLATLAALLDSNGTAPITEGFQIVVESLSSALDSHKENENQHVILRTTKYLDRAQMRLGVRQPIPSKSNTKRMRDTQATFKLIREGPGHLSALGPRHDNDHELIENIKILPTWGEISSSRTEYLPVTDSSKWHRSGIEGLVDRHFRLLREDNVGQLRDAIRAELDRLRKSAQAKKSNQGIRTNSYSNLTFEAPKCDKWNGFHVIIAIDQPKHLHRATVQQRKSYWENTNSLQKDTLVCILDAMGTAILCTVESAPGSLFDVSSEEIILLQVDGKRKDLSTEDVKLGDLSLKTNRVYLKLRLAAPDVGDGDVSTLLDHLILPRKTQPTSLVEFPGILLPAFQPTLKALQHLSITGDMPFTDLLVSDAEESEVREVSLPEYARQPDFRFELDCLLQGDQSLALSPSSSFDMAALLKGSTLDEAQAKALVDSLLRRVALIQGPPGTGKSYTGVAITRVLLANKEKANLGPILCVTYTNHALDQYLEHLYHSGVEQIIRIGSRSKSAILEPLNLRVIAQQVDRTSEERTRAFDLSMALEQDIADLQRIIQDIRRSATPEYLKDFLLVNYPHHHEQFFGSDQEGWQTVGYHAENKVQNWLIGKPPHKLSTSADQVRGNARQLDTLVSLATNIWSTSLEERKMIHAHWKQQIKEDLQHRFLISLKHYQKHKDKHDKAKHEISLRCLQRANVIGITTSGLARNLELLRRVDCKVLLCEEAGEVLESHILTALVPSIEHAILIGDHLQLRPQVNNYELSYENKSRGRQYSLDTSLFERLVQPENGIPSTRLPLSTLEIQRRMHPSISQLIGQTLYPSLKDDTKVMEYPVVTGMKERLFWLDHNYPEAGATAADVVSTSHSNNFEVEMTASLVSHLIRQGVYQANDIAVITPYLGQLFKLRSRLASSFEIVLDERDAVELEKAGMEVDENPQQRNRIAKTTLLQALKVATVDNFQGEEAKVVIISLVRCNSANNCGFLKTSNRINVLLSRAMHGMFIIGNSRTSSHVPMWAEVISILKANGNIGSSLELLCPRHKNTTISVAKSDDFVRFSPEGGCTLKCIQRLPCGHSCPHRCHSDVLHGAVRCLEPCPRPKSGCDHVCPLPCGDKCQEKCMVRLENIDLTLSCGHKVLRAPCWQYQDSSSIKCLEEVERVIPKCGHSVTVKCYVDVTEDGFTCQTKCGGLLPCGHPCGKPCTQCRELYGGLHGTCENGCGRAYSTCNHHCETTCHGEYPCPLCSKRCEIRCSHSQCNKKCSEPCTPCAESDCSSACPHSKCSMPCAAPCDWIPCSKRCEKLLGCGHQCPSLCGEACPGRSFCQLCATEDVKRMTVDFIEMQAYGEINLDEDPCIFPNCGHILTMTNMDGRLDMPAVYEMDPGGTVKAIKKSDVFFLDELKALPGCPTCRGSLRNINRYGRIVRRALLDEATKRFASWASAEYVPLAEELQTMQEKLRGLSIPFKEGSLPSKIPVYGDRAAQYHFFCRITKGQKKYGDIKRLRQELAAYASQVSKEETPFSRVRDLVESARRRSGKPGAPVNVVPQMTFDIKADSLLLRCDVTMYTHLLKQIRKVQNGPKSLQITIDFSKARDDCINLIEAARAHKDHEREVEGHIYFVRYCALESIFADPATGSHLKEDGEKHLQAARMLCETYGGRLNTLIPEVKAAGTALSDGVFKSVVSSDERRAVLEAMAKEFLGTGHWYLCSNGHPFTIGECGMPMEETRCPECGARIGGHDHAPVEGVARAEDLESELTAMQLGEHPENVIML